MCDLLVVFYLFLYCVHTFFCFVLLFLFMLWHVCCCPQNEDLEQAFSVYHSNKEVLLKEVEERGQRLAQEQQEKEDIKKVRMELVCVCCTYICGCIGDV